MFHFHFGAGALGLGLVVPVFTRLATQTYILAKRRAQESQSGNRNNCLRDKKSYITLVIDNDKQAQEPSIIRFDEFVEYDDGDLCKEDFAAAIIRAQADGIKNADFVLVTSAVKDFEATRSISVFLELLSSYLDKQTEICFCAMENGFKSSDVKSSLNSDTSVQFADCIVDRICSKIEISNGWVFVEAEYYGKIYIDQLHLSDRFALALKGSEELVITSRLEVFRVFKLGVINAAHILIAGEAQTYHMPMLHFFLTMENIGHDMETPELPERLAHLSELLSELSAGAVAIVKSMNDTQSSDMIEELTTKDNLQKVVSRFCFVPDQVGRILSRLKTPRSENMLTMSEFLRSTLDKLLPPVHAYVVEKKCGPPAVTLSFLKIAKLIADRRFVDVPVTTQ